MKDINNFLLENALDKLCKEVQFDGDKNAAYQTFYLGGSSKHKNLFLGYDVDSKSFSLIGFKSPQNLAELFGEDDDAYDSLNNLRVGDSRDIHGVIYFKIK